MFKFDFHDKSSLLQHKSGRSGCALCLTTSDEFLSRIVLFVVHTGHRMSELPWFLWKNDRLLSYSFPTPSCDNFLFDLAVATFLLDPPMIRLDLLHWNSLNSKYNVLLFFCPILARRSNWISTLFVARFLKDQWQRH